MQNFGEQIRSIIGDVQMATRIALSRSVRNLSLAERELERERGLNIFSTRFL